MSELARQQIEFQRGILTGDDSVLAGIPDGPREKRDVLFGVYRHAYGSRLVEAIRNDHELLHIYLGDEMFDAMGYAYVAANPSRNRNLRWFAQALPAFLKEAAAYSKYPILSDLAAIEKALNDAFDAEDASTLCVADMAVFTPEIWHDLQFKPHRSAIRLDLTTNASAVWQALRNGQTPPDAVILEQPCRLLIWRQDVIPIFRELSAEEAKMWDEAARGTRFGVLCSMLAADDSPEQAAARAAGYLQGWIAGGLLIAVSA